MTELTHNYQPAVSAAVQEWAKGEEARFEFCVMASQIVGQYEEGAAVELARKIERSVSSVQNYAKVGRLWNDMTPQDAEHYRFAVSYSFWPPLASLYENKVIGMTGVKHWLDEKIQNKWTVEKLRSMLPTVEGKSVWKKSAKRFLKNVNEIIQNDLIDSPAFDVDPKQYRKAARALKLAAARVEKCIS